MTPTNRYDRRSVTSKTVVTAMTKQGEGHDERQMAEGEGQPGSRRPAPARPRRRRTAGQRTRTRPRRAAPGRPVSLRWPGAVLRLAALRGALALRASARSWAPCATGVRTGGRAGLADVAPAGRCSSPRSAPSAGCWSVPLPSALPWPRPRRSQEAPSAAARLPCAGTSGARRGLWS